MLVKVVLFLVMVTALFTWFNFSSQWKSLPVGVAGALVILGMAEFASHYLNRKKLMDKQP